MFVSCEPLKRDFGGKALTVARVAQLCKIRSLDVGLQYVTGVSFLCYVHSRV